MKLPIVRWVSDQGELPYCKLMRLWPDMPDLDHGNTIYDRVQPAIPDGSCRPLTRHQRRQAERIGTERTDYRRLSAEG